MIQLEKSRAHNGGTVYLQMIMVANVIVYSDCLTFYIVQYLRANLFKNQADLYWRVIYYDPLRFGRIFFGGRPVDR